VPLTAPSADPRNTRSSCDGSERESENLKLSTGVRFGAYFGLKSDVTALPKMCQMRISSLTCGTILRLSKFRAESRLNETVAMKILFLATVLATSPLAETITYQVTGCLGSCPVYTVTVSSDGQARYNGENYVAVTGKRSFRITSSEFDTFRARLAPYRPGQGQEILVRPESDLCPEYGTDSSSIVVTWSSNGRPAERLEYYNGCHNPKAPLEMSRSLAHAWETLPISKFVGSTGRR
jgi:hypothetical protein